MNIESLPITDLVLDKQNARKHSEVNLAAIYSSLKEFGQRKPIVVTADNVVIAGNGTLQSAIKLGWKKIDVVRVPADWSEDRIRAFALADNRTAELAEWDASVLESTLFELDAIGWDFEALGFEPLAQQNFEPESELQPRLDEKNPTVCPSCNYSWTTSGGKIIEA
jgi:ParB-like chromosome segregation protein Spo0J